MRMLAGRGYFLLKCMLAGHFLSPPLAPPSHADSTLSCCFSTLRKSMHAEFLKISNACCQGGILFFLTPPVLAWNMANPGIAQFELCALSLRVHACNIEYGISQCRILKSIYFTKGAHCLTVFVSKSRF